MKRLLFLMLVTLFLFSENAFALGFDFQLLGDSRNENPDGIVVDVSIDVSSNISKWTINAYQTGNPENVKILDFYFDMNGLSNQYSFSNFIPSDWSVSTPTTVQGIGVNPSSAIFLFEVNPDQGQPNINSLSFTMQKTSDFILNDFLSADGVYFNDIGGPFQLGAHIGSLETSSDSQYDSGFAVGNYFPVPEPATMILLVIGLLALAATSKRAAFKQR